MTHICNVDDITPNTGVCALVDGKQVAIFRTFSNALYAIDNFDPFSKANVLSRGIIGQTEGITYIASPIYKQRFDLVSGQCLDDESVKLETYKVNDDDGKIVLSQLIRT